MATTHGVDPLPLLVHKVAPNQFDLSLGFAYVSLRDQMVRAAMVVKSLVAHHIVKPAKPMSAVSQPAARPQHVDLVIFGAGAAGLAAALEAHDKGLTFALIEKGPAIPGGVLTSTAQRYVSVGMYEWPHQSSTAHKFPVAPPAGVPAAVHSLDLNCAAPLPVQQFGQAVTTAAGPRVQQWLSNASGYLTPGVPKQFAFVGTTLSNASKNGLAASLSKSFDLEPAFPVAPLAVECTNGIGSPVSLSCDAIIYAVGFEQESKRICTAPIVVHHDHNPPFWEPDTFDTPHPDVDVLVIGSGDGALQDAFRFCIKRTSSTMDPLDAWNEFEKQARLQTGAAAPALSTFLGASKARLAEAEMYTTGHNMWHAQSDANYRLDMVVRGEIENWLNHPQFGAPILQALNSLQRSEIGSVTLIRRPKDKSAVDRNACFDKCYLLNRTWVWLLHAAGLLTLLNGTVDGFSASKGCGGYVSSTDAHKVPTALPPAAGSAPVPFPLAAQPYDVVILRAGLMKPKEKGYHSGLGPDQQIGILPAKVTRLDLTRIPPPLRP